MYVGDIQKIRRPSFRRQLQICLKYTPHNEASIRRLAGTDSTRQHQTRTRQHQTPAHSTTCPPDTTRNAQHATPSRFTHSGSNKKVTPIVSPLLPDTQHHPPDTSLNPLTPHLPAITPCASTTNYYSHNTLYHVTVVY